MKEIQYIKGDATQPVSSPSIIFHVCNDLGAWGSGFVVAVSNRFPNVERAYRSLDKYVLGDVQFVSAMDNVIVANMIAQRDIRTVNGVPPIRYDALDQCLFKLAERALHSKPIPSVHCPRIGTCRAGGSWDKIEPLIIKNLSERDIEVFVYDF